MVRLLSVLVVLTAVTIGCGGDPGGRAPSMDAGADSHEQPDGGLEDARVDPSADEPDVMAGGGDGDSVAPLEVWLTVDAIPQSMNGSTGIYTLTLPTEGFTVDLEFSGGTRPIDPSRVTVTVGGVPLTATPEISGDRAQILVATEDGLEPGSGVMVCALVHTDTDEIEAPCLAVDLAERQPSTDPFPEVETWLIVTSRDQFTPNPQTDVQPPLLLSSDGADGVADLDQALDALGLTSGGANPELDAVTRHRLIERVRERVSRIYDLDTADPVPIALVFEGDPGAPDPTDFSATGHFSMIALGGDMPAAIQTLETTVGRAMIDWNNQVRDDDTGRNLGIFATSIVRQAIAHPVGALVLDSFCPLLGGVPFGEGPLDAAILADGAPEPDTRAGQLRMSHYEIALDLLSLGLSTTLAHEMGHSLGLVPPGLPPVGLCAGEDLPFVVQVMDDAHIDTPGLNVMQTGAVTNYVEALGDADNVAFNPLNLAYLKRRLLVLR